MTLEQIGRNVVGRDWQLLSHDGQKPTQRRSVYLQNLMVQNSVRLR